MMRKTNQISNGVKYPNFSEEKKLWKKGYKRVAGLDEAGRGPLAGPVVAAAVTIIGRSDLQNIKDSKKLSPKKREELYKIIVKHPAIEWGIGKVSEKVIDKINILEATKLAMEKAIKNLESKLREVGPPREVRPPKIDFLILDGNFKIYGERSRTIPQKSIVKADEKVFSCASASIIAKVARDRLMQKYHKRYPQYGFDRHKGYPTQFHRAMLNKYGRCAIHRNSFHYNYDSTQTKTY